MAPPSVGGPPAGSQRASAGRSASGDAFPAGSAELGITAAWDQATRRTLREALIHKEMSSQSRKNAARTSTTAGRETRETCEAANMTLKRKVAQTEHLKSQLEHAIAQLSQEMLHLAQRRQRTAELLKAQQGPLAKARHRLKQRGLRRPHKENIHDDVQDALLDEANDLQRAVDSLSGTKGQMSATLDRMAQAKRLLTDDLEDKAAALRLDKNCLAVPSQWAAAGARSPVRADGFVRRTLADAIRSADPDAAAAPAADPSAAGDTRHIARPSAAAPADWRRATEENVAYAHDLVHTARELRARAVTFSRRAVESNSFKGERTMAALETKVRHAGRLGDRLQRKVQQLSEELADTQRQRKAVESALHEKRAPMATCVSRLKLRRRRPDREATRDDTEVALQSQLNRLMHGCTSLEEQHQELCRRESALHRMRSELERDRAQKEAARDVDVELLALDPDSALSASLGGRAGALNPSRVGCGLAPRGGVAPGMRPRPGTAPPARRLPPRG